MSGDICGDNRFEVIEKYKQKLIEATNIETSPDEMAVLDSILFRFWQMGWLPAAEPGIDEWCTDCSEYDNERHCCPRWNRVIREALKDAQPEIIRCGDCKYFKVEHGWNCSSYPICEVSPQRIITPDDYCSFAERRTDENNNE